MGKADIGTPEDGAIIKTFKISNRLIILKERSVYEFSVNNTNADLPPTTQKKILSLGNESELLSRTFLTAKRLFDSQFLPDTIDLNRGLILALESVIELDVMQNEISNYLLEEEKKSLEYIDRKSKKLDHAVPSIPDLRTRSNTIFQKANQFLQTLIDIIRLFYQDFRGDSYYTKLVEFISSKYPNNDPFVKFANQALPFITQIREIRNCLEHRKPELVIKDFELQNNLNITVPTLEIKSKTTNLEPTPLSAYFHTLSKNLISIFESFIVNVCDKHMKTDNVIGQRIAIIPESKRINKYVQFAYWSPLGDEGYYHQ